MSESDTERPTFLSDQIAAEYEGEEIIIWNRLCVREEHQVGHGLHESVHSVLAGDGSTVEKPEFVTPEMREKLRELNVYPDVEVLDPSVEEVTIL